MGAELEDAADGLAPDLETGSLPEKVQLAEGQKVLVKGAVVVEQEIPKFRLLMEVNIDGLGPAAR